jgi:hypothetical protein
MAPQAPPINGPAAAAILASGIGSLAVGLCTTLAEAIGPIEETLNFYSSVSPLSGKTTVAVVVWVVAWGVLHGRWRKQQVDFPKVFIVTLLLIALGLLGTFPLFFAFFGG